MYNSLQQREVFHLEFLRWLGYKINPNSYALKGGTNMRFFFNSNRYSDDMDIDISNLTINDLQDIVLKILLSQSFINIFKLYSIERITTQDIVKAKQTKTTQRFKIHLMTFAEEDLFTKIEFSRRGMDKGIIVKAVSNTILRKYKLPPLLVPHYNIQSAIVQKIGAIVFRKAVQARDIYDLYILSSQYTDKELPESKILNKNNLKKAYDNIFTVTFEQFQDSVVSYLPSEQQSIYKIESSWDEIRLKVANLTRELR